MKGAPDIVVIVGINVMHPNHARIIITFLYCLDFSGKKLNCYVKPLNKLTVRKMLWHTGRKEVNITKRNSVA